MVVLDDLVDPAAVERCRAAIEQDSPDYATPDRTRNFEANSGRFTVPLRIGAALGDRASFCPPAVLDIMGALLGATFALDSFGLLVSLPGAGDQKQHLDALLFPDTPIDRLLPPSAIAFSLPLVRLDETSGTTGFWSRSHVDPARALGAQDVAPIVPTGSALLWDFRVHHRGLANRGTTPRPVLFTVFCRDWWTEVVGRKATGYEKLTLSRAVHDTFDPRLCDVVRRARLVD